MNTYHVISNFIVLLICFTMFSCKNEFSSNELRPEAINVITASFKGIPILTDTTFVLKKLEKSDDIKNKTVINSNLIDKSQIKLNYQYWKYRDSISDFGYDVYKNLCYLSYVSFKSEEISVQLENFSLNNKTSIEEIKTKFPLAYKLKVANKLDSTITICLMDNLYKDNYEFANIIQLDFKNEKLDSFRYQIEPEYIFDLK